MPSEKSSIVRIRVTVLLRREDGCTCFVRHLKNGRRYWLLPGGGLEPFESLQDAARRELREELDLSVKDVRFLALRETFSREEGRHIVFPIFEGFGADFGLIGPSKDARVEGVDFFDSREISSKPIYPAFGDDLGKMMRGEPVEPFRTLAWVA